MYFSLSQKQYLFTKNPKNIKTKLVQTAKKKKQNILFLLEHWHMKQKNKWKEINLVDTMTLWIQTAVAEQV